MGFDQSDADRLDEVMLGQPISPHGVASLTGWFLDPDRGGRYAAGVGAHAVSYRPGAWTRVEPWPGALGDRGEAGRREVSRAEVVAVAREAASHGDWRAALVAAHVWGYGGTGFGRFRTERVLAQPGVGEALEKAVASLRTGDVADAYEVLEPVRHYGPAFFTKFLYFAGAAVAAPERPLILDSVLAAAAREHATAVGEAAGVADAASTAAFVWRDGGWTSHRYGVFLAWLRRGTEVLVAEDIGWPSEPDLLELAIFAGGWDGSSAPAP
ncbi:hypothetical protein [Streptomyces bohaiensis]|uniref:8-oxoguanine DNA glycosylase OGG fold protein n=1 Tax=Streptomyces bohaiensis TaxID=1431344 RepID=UPI003B7FE88F